MKSQSIVLTFALTFSLLAPAFAGGSLGDIALSGKIKSLNPKAHSFIIMAEQYFSFGPGVVNLKPPRLKIVLTNSKTTISTAGTREIVLTNGMRVKARTNLKFEDLTPGMYVGVFGKDKATGVGKPLTAIDIDVTDGSGPYWPRPR